MRALVADGRGGAELAEVDAPEPGATEALVAVRAVSLNRGEVRQLTEAGAGARFGWDVAGEVVAAAADGSGPHAGSRVVGLAPGTGWAEQVAVRTTQLAEVPDDVDLGAASTLPVAGLTALRALYEFEHLDEARVLVTGAAGGVGRFAVQLASHTGAHVTAVVGSEARGAGLARLGAHEVVVGMPSSGEYDVILESVGGASLAAALEMCAPGGLVVTYGSSSGEPTTFDVRPFFRKGGTRLYGLILAHELEHRRSGDRDLAHLVTELGAGRLDPCIDLDLPWDRCGEAFGALLSRRVEGKAVLRLA